MPPNDGEDASPSSDADLEQDYSAMSEDKLIRASSEEKSDNASNDPKPASKSNSKDPNRPRRKKARRACFACQRAHLTCGDERPCLRCIKRGLQDQCHDGVRKKAKYLHDAPPEALLPGYQSSYTVNGAQQVPTTHAGHMHEVPASQGGNYFPQTSNAYGHYSPPAQVDQQTMHSSTIGGRVNAVPGMSSPIQFQQPSSQQVSPVQEMPANFGQPHLMNNPSFEASLFDPNDPTLLNFSIQDLNFGNHYGALEFGMLGHMTSGAVNTPEMEGVDSMTNSNHGSISFEGSTNYNASGLPYSQGYQNWQTVGSRQGSTTNLLALQHNGMDAYAVADVTSSLTGTSPNSQSMDWNAPYQSNTMSPELAFTTPDHTRREETHRHRSTFPSDSRGLAQTPHRRDTKQIYASVTAPYPYTQRFHNLIKHLERHYPSDKRVRIARALSMIRPSFISLAKDLNNDDLIFMEQSFQRALVEYEDRWSMVGTPSIICRRTGEIVTCSKEFSLVTGWRKDVLLGKEPNLNVNFGSGSGTQTGTSTRGAATPRVPNFEVDSSLPQPVFITEIMDQDSVVYFFERFAELGFSASASSMPSAQCSLIRYKTKDDPGWGTKDERARIRDDGFVKRERGPSALGDDTGEIPACMTWLVKQDIFDMPMMIVINFLPCI